MFLMPVAGVVVNSHQALTGSAGFFPEGPSGLLGVG